LPLGLKAEEVGRRNLRIIVRPDSPFCAIGKFTYRPEVTFSGFQHSTRNYLGVGAFLHFARNYDLDECTGLRFCWELDRRNRKYVKDAQAEMRHSRSSTTLDIYQQFVPESRQRAVEKLSRLLNIP
jgi:hypothetical protein